MSPTRPLPGHGGLLTQGYNSQKIIIQPQEPPVMGGKEMLEHTMWLMDRQADEYWTVVAQSYERDWNGLWFEKLHMTSVLAPVVAAEKLLVDHRWLAADVFKDADASGGGQTGMRVGKNVTIEPFAMCGAMSNGFDITNDFVQFYDLRLNAGTYVAVDSACEDVDVVRIVDNERHQEISVSTRFLRNYLTHKGRVLVRQHDNLVRLKRKASGLEIKYFPERAVRGPGYTFRLEVDWSDDLAASRLIGKDLMMPFGESRDPLAPQKGRCEFVIGIDDQGREVTAVYRDGDEMCDVVSRSSMGGLCERPAMYFGEDGMCKYCFRVHFRRDILKKYLDSDRHKVDYGKVWCAQWSVESYIDDYGIVRARLGDLARLPACEQHHWRSYNVPPEGIGGRQYGGFGSMVACARGVGYGAGGFWKSFNNFQEMFEKQFSFKLFRPLSEDDAYKEDSIRVPLNDDLREVEGQIQYLSILLPDSINKSQLEQKMALLLSEPTRLTGFIDRKQLEHLNAKYRAKSEDKPERIPMLEDFLLCESLPTTIISHLRMIQNLRSSGAAHRKGRRYEKNVSRYGLDKTSGKEFIRKMFVDMTSAFNDLTNSISK